jgi:hypothetical protein
MKLASVTDFKQLMKEVTEKGKDVITLKESALEVPSVSALPQSTHSMPTNHIPFKNPYHFHF